MYCYRIPRDCFEDELVPVFQTIGKLYELRLMIEFSGANRSYCYVRYCNPEDAKRAITALHNYQIRPGYPLAVTESVDNRRLCIKTQPPLDHDVTEAEAARELGNILEGVTGAKFIARRWLQVEFESHRMAALARRQLVPGNMTMFGHVEIKQVDWADPEVEGFVRNLMTSNNDNKVVSVGNVGPDITEESVKHWFNMMTHGQVDNVVKSGSQFLITFHTAGAANMVMDQGDNLMAGGHKLSLAWWRPSQHSPPVAAVAPTIIGPLERLHTLCLRQQWGSPQYHCATYLDTTGQCVYQYNVSLPNISRHHVYGEASHDKHMALINSACAALQGITEASLKMYSSQHAAPSHYRTPPTAANFTYPPPPPPPAPLTLLQPPPGPRRRPNIQTVARPTKEETNLLVDDNCNIAPPGVDDAKPTLAVSPMTKSAPSVNRAGSVSNLEGLRPFDNVGYF